MSATDKPSASPISGRIRIDARARKLASRLEPGDIAVIDQSDIDRATAQAIIASAPAAVLNAAPSVTGRHTALGPRMILDAGIRLVDDLGQDLMTLREGEDVTVDEDTVTRGGVVIATGRVVEAAVLDRLVEGSETTRTQIRSFAASVEDYLDRDGPLLLEGTGVPDLSALLGGRIVLLVLGGSDAHQQLARIRRWRRDAAPVVIAIESGVEAARRHRLSPTIVIGDMDLVAEKALRAASELVVVSGHDGVAPGRDRLDRMGVDYRTIEMMGGAEEAAILIAARSGARAIVTAGAHHGVEDFIDQGRASMAPVFFTRLRAGDLLVGADAVAAVHRHRIGGWGLLLLALTVLGALGAALWSTPWGHDALTGLVGPLMSLFGSSSPDAGGPVG
ncbi:putative cytokinetic ring protein SteA [Actinomyces sp. B33]|uniref:putative cytokinetic ring protein SteA n=1 Tax=Actinomyces sp. B33 TaxID=2942131 RepID=UPI002340C4D5|nr:putative cytokinetic ring protein SteA [Actinomyces sp. B33]MDC4233393.1 putative cytokinetic ring protein SteA [Actinomyces sp. B33]